MPYRAKVTPSTINGKYFRMGVGTIPHHSSPKAKAKGAYTAETYQRRDDHKARTSHKDEDSYILTLMTDPDHHKAMTALREKYFPPHINKLEAHIALFRALPGSELQRIVGDIENVCGSSPAFGITATNAFRMGHGVGINVQDESRTAHTIYNELKAKWDGFLSRQDQSFKPHYTVQNKVDDPTVVDQTMKELEEFQGNDGQVLGLMLYRYDRGFWRTERSFEFGRKDVAS